MIAIRGDNKNDTMPFCRCARNGAPGADAFIIGMGMETNES
jgi:hypothetical protein